MVLAELIAGFIVILSSVYIYYKYVIFNFWRKRGVFYIEPAVPVGNVTPLVTGKAQVASVNKLTMIEATAQGFVFFAAGFETSSSAATFVLYELAQHQDIQDKIQNEIDEILSKHGDLTYDAINDMTYLHKVINEALRLHRPLPILNRICTEEIDLPTVNIRVPKGTLITIPMLGLHRDPSIYPDPNKFDPERFNADKVKERHPYAFIPFGEGPRNCIGMRFGYLQIKIGLVSLLSKYKFKLHSRTPVPLTYSERSPTLTPKSGVHLIIEKR